MLSYVIRLLIFISMSSSIRMCIISFMSFGQYHGGVVDCFGMYNVVGCFFDSISSTKTDYVIRCITPTRLLNPIHYLPPRYCTLHVSFTPIDNVVVVHTWLRQARHHDSFRTGNCTLDWLFPRSSLHCTHMSPPDVCLLYRVWPILHPHLRHRYICSNTLNWFDCILLCLLWVVVSSSLQFSVQDVW